MTLDLARIVSGIDAMIAAVDPAADRERFDALTRAWQAFDSGDVRHRLDKADNVAFYVARSSDDYRSRSPLPQLPERVRVVATDGSLIQPDRHSPARFYLLNIGQVVLDYGPAPAARFATEPLLHFAPDDLTLTIGSRRVPVNDTILGVRRATAELESVIAIAAGAQSPVVALQDGTLILWPLTTQQPDVIKALIPRYLDVLREIKQHGIPVASYISAPQARDLMNAVRVAVCDYPRAGRRVDCADCRGRFAIEGRMPACDILPNIPDRALWADIAGLQPGERSGVFGSDTPILSHYPDDVRIDFFYLNVGGEIARIEIPRWVARDRAALDLVHAVIYDQCRLGRGYPVALQEAHEQAVLSMSDRRLVEETIERRLASLGVVVRRSGKDMSKRGRFV